jgi:hypothetical protein
LSIGGCPPRSTQRSPSLLRRFGHIPRTPQPRRHGTCCPPLGHLGSLQAPQLPLLGTSPAQMVERSCMRESAARMRRGRGQQLHLRRHCVRDGQVLYSMCEDARILYIVFDERPAVCVQGSLALDAEAVSRHHRFIGAGVRGRGRAHQRVSRPCAVRTDSGNGRQEIRPWLHLPQK